METGNIIIIEHFTVIDRKYTQMEISEDTSNEVMETYMKQRKKRKSEYINSVSYSDKQY